MNNYLKKTMLIFISLILINISASSQILVDVTWGFGLNIQIPDDMEIKINTEEQFEAANDYMLIHVDFFDRSYMADERIAQAMVEVAQNNGLALAEVSGGALNGDTMGGAFLQGNIENSTLKIMGLVGKGKSWGCLIDLYYNTDKEKVAHSVFEHITYTPNEE